jgi:Fic family protein
MCQVIMDSGLYEMDASGRRCFRPAIPHFPRLEDILDRLDPAQVAIGEFDRAVLAFERGGVIGRLFARLDAVHSSGAEGTTTTFTELMEFESSLHAAADPEDAASVSACARAVEEAEHGGAEPVELMLRIHRRLFERSRNRMAARAAGRLKEHANGTVDGEAPGGFFYYTRPQSVPAALQEWGAFTLADSARTPEVVRQILSHWMLEHIHPTADGNGRVGRLLVPLMMRSKNATRSTCAFFGEAVHEDKQLYVEALKAARLSGDMTAWTRLMLGALQRTAEANLGRIERLAQLHAGWMHSISKYRSDSIIHTLAPFALTQPAFTIADALHAIGGTFASVNTAAGRLVDIGILQVGRGTRRNRLFLAWKVLDLFDRFRTTPQPQP